MLKIAFHISIHNRKFLVSVLAPNEFDTFNSKY